MARPRLKLDESQIQKLAHIQCPTDQIAWIMGCSKDTLERRYAALIHQNREIGKGKLKQILYQKAMEGQPWAVIFALKNYEGFKDRQDVQVEVSGTIKVDVEMKQRLVREVREILDTLEECKKISSQSPRPLALPSLQ